ncbi:hypothetical protein BC940DRAFT_372090 [Gongronella butleri]|nr:hypothetical protein BC940DRAFT_372090 [Gongronella butleri]
MDLASLLNPIAATSVQSCGPHRALTSPPPSPKRECGPQQSMKPRSRFSLQEDTIICEGVANGLTWGQISGRLPHRKRATCFNRYRTLQGIRKSRKQAPHQHQFHHGAHPYHHSHHAHHHHGHEHHPSKLTIQRWLPSPPPTLTDPFEPCYERRLSVSSAFSTASLPSPASTLYQYHSSRRSSTASTCTIASSPAHPYHH